MKKVFSINLIIRNNNSNKKRVGEFNQNTLKVNSVLTEGFSAIWVKTSSSLVTYA